MSYFNVDVVEVRESEWIKIGVDTGSGKTACARVPHTGSGFLVMRISLSAQPRENLSSRASDCTLKVMTIGESVSEFEVSKRPVCEPLLSVEEYTTMGGVAFLYGDKSYLFHKGSKGDPQFQIPRFHSCAQRKQRVQHLHEAEMTSSLWRALLPKGTSLSTILGKHFQWIAADR